MVKCVECGFLQLRRLNSSERDTADQAYRSNGLIHSSGSYNAHHAEPFCWKGVNLENELEKVNDVKVGHDLACKERACSEFVLWRPGRSAEWHDDMTLLEAVKEENRRFQEESKRQAEADRAEAKEQVVKDRDVSQTRFQKQLDATIKGNLRRDIIALLTFLISLGSLIVAIRGCPINDGGTDPETPSIIKQKNQQP